MNITCSVLKSGHFFFFFSSLAKCVKSAWVDILHYFNLNCASLFPVLKKCLFSST